MAQRRPAVRTRKTLQRLSNSSSKPHLHWPLTVPLATVLMLIAISSDSTSTSRSPSPRSGCERPIRDYMRSVAHAYDAGAKLYSLRGRQGWTNKYSLQRGGGVPHVVTPHDHIAPYPSETRATCGTDLPDGFARSTKELADEPERQEADTHSRRGCREHGGHTVCAASRGASRAGHGLRSPSGASR